MWKSFCHCHWKSSFANAFVKYILEIMPTMWKLCCNCQMWKIFCKCPCKHYFSNANVKPSLQTPMWKHFVSASVKIIMQMPIVNIILKMPAWKWFWKCLCANDFANVTYYVKPFYYPAKRMSFWLILSFLTRMTQEKISEGSKKVRMVEVK